MVIYGTAIGVSERSNQRESQRYKFTTLNNYNYKSPSGACLRPRSCVLACWFRNGVFNKRCSASRNITCVRVHEHIYYTRVTFANAVIQCT